MNFIEARQHATTVAEIALAHQAHNLRILDVTQACDYADYFILMSATSARQARALADAISEKSPLPVQGVEGYTNGEWVLLDMGELIVHIFYEPVRGYYHFDKLWGHVPSVQLQDLIKRTRASLTGTSTSTPAP